MLLSTLYLLRYPPSPHGYVAMITISSFYAYVVGQVSMDCILASNVLL